MDTSLRFFLLSNNDDDDDDDDDNDDDVKLLGEIAKDGMIADCSGCNSIANPGSFASLAAVAIALDLEVAAVEVAAVATGSSSMKNAISPTSNGNIDVILKTSVGPITSNKLPEKYADIKPPIDADPQHKLCNPPAILGSFESLVLCTTMPSATTSEKAIQPLLITNEATVACIMEIPFCTFSPRSPPSPTPAPTPTDDDDDDVINCSNPKNSFPIA
mmetsp:Transcript_19880/g.24520  ORF Transcript_19880/g.24520 Transcript_19880/m.24520 type:complete len:217 (+) Transcript_19880:932-1582(+)